MFFYDVFMTFIKFVNYYDIQRFAEFTEIALTALMAGNHIDEYINLQVKYDAIYDQKCVVLMETGSFLEIYGVDNDDEKIGDVKGVAELLNIQTTRRNKKILENSRKNPLMAGFPTHAMNRFVNILLGANYTVILVEQHNVGGKKFKREVSRILSPGTYIDETFDGSANNIVSVFIDAFGGGGVGGGMGERYVVGVSVLDLSTADAHVYEIYSDAGSNNGMKVFEEAYRFVESFNPSEIVIKTRGVKKLNGDDVKDIFNINGRVSHIRFNEIGQEVKLEYQNSVLGKVYKNCGLLTPIEFVGLESKIVALVSYVMLLQFAYEHDEKIVQKIGKPKFWKDKKHMILTNNTLYQLNIVRDGAGSRGCGAGIGSLFDVINGTKTAMGKRLLNFRLLNPIVNKADLEKRWDCMDKFADLESGEISDLVEQLLVICDIERYHRKIAVGVIHPCEMANLVCSYDAIMELFKLLNEWMKNDGDDGDGEVLMKSFMLFLKDYYDMYNVDIMSKYRLNDIEESFIKKGYDEDVDNLSKEINEIEGCLIKECEALSKVSGEEIDVRLDRNDRDGYFYIVGNGKVTRLKKFIEDALAEKGGEIEWMKRVVFKKKTTALTKIETDISEKLSVKLVRLKKKMTVLMRGAFLRSLDDFDKKYGVLLKKISTFIARLDIDINNYAVSKKYGYCRPVVVDESDDGSFIDAVEVRHPIIERLDSGFEYVPNDVRIGIKGVGGVMLYGLNGCGKSSYLKSIGLNLVLAQMGMFVAAKSFKFKPFTHLFTRILGNDNLFKGMSSFTVEMTELRSILCHSDSRSLVLGDEVCKGTETVSAVSIVGASIDRFVKRRINFVFTTHYHQLVNLSGFKKVLKDGCVKCFHFGIKKKEGGAIIYDRKLADGNGESVYGIEVAKYIIDDLEFIKKAEEIRKEVMGISSNLVSGGVGDSKYNGKLIMDRCYVCDGDVESGQLDVHHIKFQSDADKCGLFEHVSKNDMSNLVVLCKNHHVMVHSGQLLIEGWEERLSGRVLVYHFAGETKIVKNDRGVSGRKKLCNEEIVWLQRLVNEEKISKKIVLKKLKDEKGIKISAGTLGKVIKGSY